jgi:hypothetical protein
VLVIRGYTVGRWRVDREEVPCLFTFEGLPFIVLHRDGIVHVKGVIAVLPYSQGVVPYVVVITEDKSDGHGGA